MANLFSLEGGRLIAFLGKLHQLGVTAEEAEQCLTRDDVAKVRVHAFKTGWEECQPNPVHTHPEPALTPVDLTVDYGKTIEEMVVAGEYDGYVNPNITTRNFPVTGTGVVEQRGKLVHFNRNMTDAAVDEWCKAHSYRRATALEVLTLGSQHKDLQRQFPIISGQAALIDGRRRVVSLGSEAALRNASLYWFDDSVWGACCRLLVFPQ